MASAVHDSTINIVVVIIIVIIIITETGKIRVKSRMLSPRNGLGLSLVDAVASASSCVAS